MAQIVRYGPTIGPGEARAAQKLADELPSDWTIICNKTVYNDFGDKREIDLVVVGRHGVYVLDEKGWAGRITAHEGHWTLPSGEELHSPVDKVSMTATFLAMPMKRSIPALDAYLGGRYFVFGYVLFSSPKASLVGLDGAVRNKVLFMSAAAQTLRGLDASRKGNPGDVEQYRKEIIDWFGRPPKIPEEAGAERSWRRHPAVYVAVLALIGAAVAAGAFLLNREFRAGSSPTAFSSGSPSSAPSVGASTPALAWDEARSAHDGDFVVVEGRVTGTPGTGGNNVYLNLGVAYAEGQSTGFAVWLRPDSLGESADTLQTEFTGQLVKAAGVVHRDSAGRPYIVIVEPTAIWHGP